jgi:hypothetical protein
VTPNEVLAVAATASRGARPEASKPNAKTDKADFIDPLLSFADKGTFLEKTHYEILIVTSRQNFSARPAYFFHEPKTQRRIESRVRIGDLPILPRCGFGECWPTLRDGFRLFCFLLTEFRAGCQGMTGHPEDGLQLAHSGRITPSGPTLPQLATGRVKG